MSVSGVCPVHRHTALFAHTHRFFDFFDFFISGEGTMGRGQGRTRVDPVVRFFRFFSTWDDVLSPLGSTRRSGRPLDCDA